VKHVANESLIGRLTRVRRVQNSLALHHSDFPQNFDTVTLNWVARQHHSEEALRSYPSISLHACDMPSFKSPEVKNFGDI
jgi:hypothetical protein